MKRPSGDQDGWNSGQGARVRRLSPVPSALIDQTSWKLSNAIRPESEESGMGPLALLGAQDSNADLAGLGRSCDCPRPGPPLHAPAAKATAREVERVRPNLMPLLRRGLAGRFPTWSNLTGRKEVGTHEIGEVATATLGEVLPPQALVDRRSSADHRSHLSVFESAALGPA